MTLSFLWLQYLILAVVIMVSGSRLVRDAEVIADRTRLGGTLVGVLLLSIVTSLPELFSGVGAVLFTREPDLLVGNVVGSLLFNLLIFAGVSFFLKKGEWEKMGTPSLLLSGLLSVCMTLVYILAHWISSVFSMPVLGWIGWHSFPILIIYIVFIYILYRFEKSHQSLEGEKKLDGDALPLNKAVTGFCINSFFVVGAGTYLPVVAEKIAVLSGMAHSFMGFIFLAIATSLPELVVVGQAVRLGLVHMALGDVFGSNLFDIAIIPLADMLYFSGDVLRHSSLPILVGAAVSVIMTAILLIALKMKLPGKVLGRIRISALLIIGLYILSVILMLKLS